MTCSFLTQGACGPHLLFPRELIITFLFSFSRQTRMKHRRIRPKGMNISKNQVHLSWFLLNVIVWLTINSINIIKTPNTYKGIAIVLIKIIEWSTGSCKKTSVGSTSTDKVKTLDFINPSKTSVGLHWWTSYVCLKHWRVLTCAKCCAKQITDISDSG